MTEEFNGTQMPQNNPNESTVQPQGAVASEAGANANGFVHNDAASPIQNNAQMPNTPGTAPAFQNNQNIPPYMPPYINGTPMPTMPVQPADAYKPIEKIRPENEAYAQSDFAEIPQNKKIKGSVAFVFITLIILALFAIGIFALGYYGIIKPDTSQSMTALASRPVDGEPYTVEQIGEYIRPAVVEIYCFSEKVSDGHIDASKAYATGSGVIISEDGYIVTNQHVISGAVQVEVIVYDENNTAAEESEGLQSYTATVVGYDAKTDLAVIKISASNLVAAQFGNSDEAVLGEQVVAIGNPSGYAGTLTVGIISALNREVRTEATGYYMTCIQTDAPISPGNSGGALVNMYGQLIGITSSKIASTNVEGIGFAITVNEAKPIIDDIIELGYVSGRYRIGIEFYSDFELEMLAVEGIYITAIREDSDVFNTELKEGDVITHVNGVAVNDFDSLTAALEGFEAGDVVHASVVRIDEDYNMEEFDIEFELVPDTSGDY